MNNNYIKQTYNAGNRNGFKGSFGSITTDMDVPDDEETEEEYEERTDREAEERASYED